MSFFSRYIGIIKAAAIIALVVGLFGFGYHTGSGHVQGKWDSAELTRANAEKAAVLARVAQNQELFRKQEHNSERIADVHKTEINRVRADIARAPGLRPGAAVCGQFAGKAGTESAGGSNGADTGGGLVSADVQRDIDALMLRVEEAFAAGRAAQDFIQSNGMAPK